MESPEKLRILLATGIYPPAIGGPAQYAKNLKKALEDKGNEVVLVTYNIEHGLPSGIRHIVCFLKIFFKLADTDFVIALDTFSVGMPATLAAWLFRKKIIIRTGGDFLWESYVERTGDLVLFKDFYAKTRKRWSVKERIIFRFTRFTLRHASAVVFSTEWQRDIFVSVYNIKKNRTAIIENFYGEKLSAPEVSEKRFVGGSRQLKWKNIPILKSAFAIAQKKDPSVFLDVENLPHDKFLEKIRNSYAVVLVSLGDISPNMVLDALRYNKPVILTRETGFFDKLKNVALFVDPQNPKDIAEKILLLADEVNYRTYRDKAARFLSTHSYKDIAEEFIKIYNQ